MHQIARFPPIILILLRIFSGPSWKQENSHQFKAGGLYGFSTCKNVPQYAKNFLRPVLEHARQTHASNYHPRDLNIK